MCRAHTCGRPLWGEALQAHSGYEMHLDVIDPPLHTHTHTQTSLIPLPQQVNKQSV